MAQYSLSSQRRGVDNYPLVGTAMLFRGDTQLAYRHAKMPGRTRHRAGSVGNKPLEASQSFGGN